MSEVHKSDTWFDRLTKAQFILLLVVGWLLLCALIYASGYRPQEENYVPPITNNDPNSPCYGLTALECKWN